MSACVFCKIIKKEIPTQSLFENAEFIVIRDIQPQSKHHALIIPKQHFATLEEASQHGALEAMSQNWLKVALHTAVQLGIASSGYRLVLNQNEEGGQTVFHLHLHLLGGERLSGRFA